MTCVSKAVSIFLIRCFLSIPGQVKRHGVSIPRDLGSPYLETKSRQTMSEITLTAPPESADQVSTGHVLNEPLEWTTGLNNRPKLHLITDQERSTSAD